MVFSSRVFWGGHWFARLLYMHDSGSSLSAPQRELWLQGAKLGENNHFARFGKNIMHEGNHRGKSVCQWTKGESNF